MGFGRLRKWKTQNWLWVVSLEGLRGYKCYYKRLECSGRVLIDESSNYKNGISLEFSYSVKSLLKSHLTLWNATQARFLLWHQCKIGRNVILTNHYECTRECTLMRNMISSPFTNNSIRVVQSENVLQTYYYPSCCPHALCKALQVVCSTVFCYFDIKITLLKGQL